MSKVLIVEDHRLVAEGLRLGLIAEGFKVLTTPGDPALTRADVLDFDPDIVLLDLGLGAHGTGLDMMPDLAKPGRYVVVLTGETDPKTLGAAFDLGATAVLDKAIPFPSLVAELNAVTDGGTQAADQRRHDIRRRIRRIEAAKKRQLEPFDDLTPREEQVLSMLVDGRQASEIAELSYVSLSTVRTQIRGVLSKLGVSSQLAAVSMAVKAEWQPRNDA